MEKGFLGVGLVSLTIFLSSCVATQPQVKQTKTPELQVEVKAAPPKEEAKPEAAPAVPAPVAEPAQPAAPKAPAPEAAAPAAPAPETAAPPASEEAKPEEKKVEALPSEKGESAAGGLHQCATCNKEVGEGHVCGVTTYCQQCKEEVGAGHICDLTFFCHDCKKEVGD